MVGLAEITTRMLQELGEKTAMRKESLIREARNRRGPRLLYLEWGI